MFDNEQAHALLISADEVVLFTDSRYYNACIEAAQHLNLDIDIQMSENGYVDFSADYLSNLLQNNENFDSRTIRFGIEDTISVNEYRKLQNRINPDIKIIETSDFVSRLRSIKDQNELASMKKAQEITEEAFKYIYEIIETGMTESYLTEKLEGKMKELGATDLAFSTIIATGDNAANPHAQPGKKVVQPGDCVLFDFGASYHDYCSDMTRCIFMGKPEEGSELSRAYDAVKAAHIACAKAIKPGVCASKIQEIADNTIKEHGFEGKMGHSLGHGVGIEVHEHPFIKKFNNEPLAVGNVVTVEPGVYLPGKFGIRLEDCGVITENGYKPFTTITHDMIVKC